MKIIEVIYMTGANANVPFDEYERTSYEDGTVVAEGTITVDGEEITQMVNVSPRDIMRVVERKATPDELAQIKGLSVAGKNSSLSGPKGAI